CARASAALGVRASRSRINSADAPGFSSTRPAMTWHASANIPSVWRSIENPLRQSHALKTWSRALAAVVDDRAEAGSVELGTAEQVQSSVLVSPASRTSQHETGGRQRRFQPCVALMPQDRRATPPPHARKCYYEFQSGSPFTSPISSGGSSCRERTTS